MAKKIYRSNSLTITEQELLLSVTETYEDLALFQLELNTGIRREDIVKIQLGNIHLDKKELTFWEAKKRRWYSIPLSNRVIPDLTRYISTLPRGQKELFTISGRTAYNRLQKYLTKAGITKHLSFHDLRRTFIKTAKKKGIDIKAVSQITGDSFKTIQDHYENLDMDELREELEKLD